MQSEQTASTKVTPITSLLVDDPGIGIHPPAYRLPAAAKVGRVRIAVSKLARSVEFYTGIIGLKVLESEGTLARLGAHGQTVVLLELEELLGVEPIGRRGRLGLYHTAFLLPGREALSSFVQHLRQLDVHFGADDHSYSEALYLTAWKLMPIARALNGQLKIAK